PVSEGGLARVVGAPTTGTAPPPSGYFHLRGVGAWRSLRGDRRCAAAVHRSSWEPRPLNKVPNHVSPQRSTVRAAFAARPRSVDGSYSARWDTWLLPRV